MKFVKESLTFICMGTLTVLLSGCDEPTYEEQVKAYPMMTIEKGKMTFFYELPATVKGINDIDIYPQVSGTIVEICFKEGMEVKKGQELFKINPTIYEARYEKAKANVANAQAALSTAKFNKDAKENLLTKSAVSRYDTVSAKNSYDAALATLSEMEAELKSAKEDLDNTVIRSPVNGLLGMSDIRVGALVTTNMAKPLVSVSDSSYIRAYFSLTESEILFIKKTRNDSPQEAMNYYTVKFRLADGSEYDRKGYIDAISGIVDSTTGAVSVRATFPNPYKIIQSGGAGTVVIPIDINDSIIIPQTATYEIQNKVFVYKYVDGKAVATAVELMDVNDGINYVVEKGLEVGDVIVTDGAGLLNDGQVITRKEQPSVTKPAVNEQDNKSETPAAEITSEVRLVPQEDLELDTKNTSKAEATTESASVEGNNSSDTAAENGVQDHSDSATATAN